MNHMPKDLSGSKLESAEIVQLFTEKSNAPAARKPEGPLLGRLPPSHGYWKDPTTGQEFSGGMEIAPTTPSR